MPASSGRPDAIARIGVSVLPPHLKMIDHGVTAADRASHLTSVTYQMALAALAPEAAYALSPAAAAPLSPQLAAFMARIQVRADDALLRAGYPARWAAHVTVTARTGRRQHAVADVPGDPSRPFGEAEVRDKFVRVLAPLMDAARAEAMFATALAAPERPSNMLETLRQVFAAALKA